MYFYENLLFPEFWNDTIIPMIKYNYITDKNANDALVLEAYTRKNAIQLKKEIESSRNINKLIIYQLEPLLKDHWWAAKGLIKNLKHADEIWDYDLDNIEVLRQHGINAKFKPIKYFPLHTPELSFDDMDIDVLFFGRFTPKREQLIRQITTSLSYNYDELWLAKKNFLWVHNVNGELLEKYINRSKIVINLLTHDCNQNRQNQTRIAYLLNRNKLVLSEKAPINYFGDSIIEFTDAQDYKEKLLDIFLNEKWKNIQTNYHLPYKRIACFFHVDQTKSNWAVIFSQQIKKLYTSGLINEIDHFHVGVNGDEPLPEECKKINRIKINNNKHLESDTLYDLWKFSQSAEGYRILYLNNNIDKKNIIHDDNHLDHWYRYIEEFNINHWQKCLNLLKEHDCVGTECEHNIINEENTIWYKGNIWWANSNYIKSLDPVFLYENQSKDSAQYWIGTGFPNYFYFCNSNKNFEKQIILEYDYQPYKSW